MYGRGVRLDPRETVNSAVLYAAIASPRVDGMQRETYGEVSDPEQALP